MTSDEKLFPIPHYHDLSRYCRMLTGTPWDGDDILQETIFKVLKSVPSAKTSQLPKA
ncbi:sigma factor [Paenibacillus allorhizosphaerae]|uniref:RNA polymerase sigma-70 region 2 domain-containing protein n=1 Tax=Paenibacillus allorhizosphaerae TaxID=2849866 RepID=A0ABM8VU90_9BACL|nr:sigma factor [Paenibacillus allorhizosphaerae]CAG7658261.1 hypothetical protein PAECIP111802_06998 [Paenibacillus allorhizosphaerae]